MTKEILHNYLIHIGLNTRYDNFQMIDIIYSGDLVTYIKYEHIINGYITSDFYTISNRLIHRYIISQRKEKLKIINKL